jgi:hypothetical protein
MKDIYGWASANSVQDASAHEAAVGFRFGAPDHTGETDDGAPD